MEVVLVVFGVFMAVHFVTDIHGRIDRARERKENCLRYNTSPTKEQLEAKQYYDKICK